MISKELNLKIGQILIAKGALKQEQLETALEQQKSSGANNRKLGSYLIDLDFVSEEEVTNALALQFNLPVISLDDIRIKPDVIDILSETLIKKFNVIPVFLIEKELTIAISDPSDIQLLDIISSETKCRVIPVLAPYSEISRTIKKYYARQVQTQLSESDNGSRVTELSRVVIEELRQAGADQSVIKIVDRILIEAVEDKSSDIHIEPRENDCIVRFRIDGILQEYATYPVKLSRGIVSRIKVLAHLDISERQKPQDGRIQIKIENNEVDLRVSTLPTIYGEKVVIRLLNRSSVRIKVEDLGFSERNLESFLSLISEPYGILLVTGPTGSGKTTTLYAAINAINSIDRNIVTIEDPVEYSLPIINQVQINPRKDLTFANVLRSILRQDPDVIMIGEIRDPETAAISAESALTGHLVFSTLHTNDSPSSITRLTEMGVEPFLLAPSLLGVIAQRLARKICPDCKEEYVPSESELSTVGLAASIENIRFYRGEGCRKCKHTGYKGRIAIHEILVVDEKIRELITKRASVNIVREAAARNGFKDMRFDGLKKVLSGDISFEELLRVTRDAK